AEMITTKIKRLVASAAVRLSKMGGQGVLVPGGYILTAAHCIEWDGRGAMALGDYFIEKVEAKGNRQLLASPAFSDPGSDLAAPEALDNQTSFDEADAFEAFCDETEPVPVSGRVLEVNESLPVHVLTHKGRWVTATLTRYGVPGSLPGGRVFLQADKD